MPVRSRRSPAGSATSSTLLSHSAPEAWGLRARSKEQRFALELLLDPAIEVVALDGRAGTGKTVLAIAAGLEQVVEHGRYERLAVYRPLVPVGRADVGFLPGGLDEKLDPWMSAIHDADRRAHRPSHRARDARRLIDELTSRGQLSLESVTFLRGRSLQRQMVVIDEAQNLEPTTLRTILTRVGEGTKVVFTGDTSQIDAPYLGESNNALAVLTQAFGGQSLLRPHHADRLRAQRRRQPRRRAALSALAESAPPRSIRDERDRFVVCGAREPRRITVQRSDTLQVGSRHGVVAGCRVAPAGRACPPPIGSTRGVSSDLPVRRPARSPPRRGR